MADDAAAAGGGESQNVKVMMRVRPFNKRELAIQAKSKEPLQCVVRMRDNTCAIMEYGRDDRGFPTEKEREAFAFDECFWSLLPDQAICPGKVFADQKHVYDRSGLLAMQAAFTGYNVCIFAYGQTGSGKTHSMLGSSDDPGISPRLCDDMFARIDKEKETRPVKVVVECLFFEIYNEKVRDLFNKKAKEGEYDAPKIRQHPMKGVYVEGLTRKEVSTSAQAKTLIEKGTKERAMAETKMNAHSSRSHAIFQIQLIQNDAMKGTQKVSNINLVDLAGSEKIKMSGVSGDALKEATNINQSLSTLRKVIDTLIENSGIKNKKNHRLPPFRESVLTYVLSDSLGGNSKTQMIATVSPHESNADDTINTLRYALRAKAIVCNARVNEEKSAAMLDAMRDEILALQMKLREGPTGTVDPRASEEIRKEIEAKENEMKQMEEQQQEMQGMLEQAKAKEAELTVAVTQQKKERFAAAFRNAFLLTTEKQKQATSKAESEALTLEKAALEEQLKNVQRQLDETKQDLAETRERADTDGARLSKELTDRELTITQLRKQLTLVTEESAFLRTQNEGLLGKVESAQNAQSDATRQMQRAQSELLAAIAAAEQAAHEAKTTKEELERRLASERDNSEQLRRRKDTYKQMYLQANAEGAARNTLLEAMREDRTTFVHTIRAQQAVVSEHSAAATRFADERREAHAKANTLQAQLTANEAQMRGMHDALREYQLAAAEFIFDNNTMQRELQRQQIGSPSTGTALAASGFAGSPVAAIGGGSVAGYASPSPHRSGISVRATSPHVSVTGRHVDPLAGAGSPRRFY